MPKFKIAVKRIWRTFVETLTIVIVNFMNLVTLVVLPIAFIRGLIYVYKGDLYSAVFYLILTLVTAYVNTLL